MSDTATEIRERLALAQASAARDSQFDELVNRGHWKDAAQLVVPPAEQYAPAEIVSLNARRALTTRR